ncbi:hypothetical protein AcV5_000295 [Taiwanofungus camphoratus]|nr:hypothetical protein AcV5_000295 [Antrodia cinnamomea]
MFSYLQHRQACARKQLERKTKRAQLPAVYSEPSTDDDEKVLGLSLPQLVSECNTGNISPSAILHAYGKRALLAQDATNCIADIMFDEAEQTLSLHRPLTGVVVGLKECVDIAGHDSTVGYSAAVGRPKGASSPIVRLLQDAGALIHAKTTLPTGLLSFETKSDVYGETRSPYNPKFSPGASTGGGGALLAYQGSVVEVGTDVGGSVRFPAANCGLYSMKGSGARFPAAACVPSAVAGMPVATSPMARTLEDLEEFWKRVVEMRPWEYDRNCVQLPWRPVDFILAGRQPKWGVIWDDGVIPPTAACRRALAVTVDALRKEGHEVIDFISPSPLEGLRAGFQLVSADGGASLVKPLRTFESITPVIRDVWMLYQLPRFVKRLYAYLLRLFSRPLGRNEAWASMVEVLYPKSTEEVRKLFEQVEEYKAAWHTAWQEQGIDFVLTIPHALPPMPNGGSGTATLISANYSFLYNVLDVVSGTMPVTYVDATLDRVPQNFKRSPEYQNMNDIARRVHSLYDPVTMHGLPLGVQVIGGHLSEEKVLEGMKIAERALWEGGKGFVAKKF